MTTTEPEQRRRPRRRVALGPGRVGLGRVGLGRLAWGRLGLAGLLAVLVALVPAAAFAKFTRTASASVSVGTASLAAPSTSNADDGQCPTKKNAGSMTVTFPNVALADSYTVVLEPPSGANVTRSITSGTTGTTFTLAKGATGTYTTSVTSVRGSWTSTPLVRTFSC